ncbi:hypothetical protein [Sporocytophaga myxococcoides]|uniref:hypothetical protein n=1 Tax=Sporocytophaga myxococcoides TaxID=153721 RepID=UPI0012DE1425|nr:hypothetical protein [Sporocytophaga myxococcoides]
MTAYEPEYDVRSFIKVARLSGRPIDVTEMPLLDQAVGTSYPLELVSQFSKPPFSICAKFNSYFFI